MTLLDKYERRKKKYLAYLRESNEIDDKIKKLPYVELDEPFYSGWKIVLGLRDDIIKRKDSDFLSHLLDIGYKKNTKIWKVKHVRLVRKGIYWYWKKNWKGKWVKTSFIPPKIRYYQDKYDKLSERERVYFVKHYDYTRKGEIIRHYYKINLPKYYLRLKCIANLVTHVQTHDSKLYKRKAEIDKFLEEYWQTCPGARSWRRWDNGERDRRERRLEKQLIEEGYEQWYEENQYKKDLNKGLKEYFKKINE